MGDIEIQPYIVCFFVAMGLIAIGATIEYGLSWWYSSSSSSIDVNCQCRQGLNHK